MNFPMALTQILNRGPALTRTAWRDPELSVFMNESGEIVIQKLGNPQAPFMASPGDMTASDWEFVR